MSKTDDDFPELGELRRGMVLVCHGDDRPDQFADWLKTLVADFASLFSIACEFGIDLDPQDGSAPIVDVMDFCQRLGIEFSSNMWEGSLISGIYRFGWLKAGTVRSASAHGRTMLRAVKKQANVAVRLEVHARQFAFQCAAGLRCYGGQRASASEPSPFRTSSVGHLGRHDVVPRLTQQRARPASAACVVEPWRL